MICLSRGHRISGGREEGPRANANGGSFEVYPARCLRRAGTWTGGEARRATEGSVGGRSGRPVVWLGSYGILSARKRPSLALLDGGYRSVVGLAGGDARERRFLTASSKASQSTSGRWSGRQGEQSPHVVVTETCCYSPGLLAGSEAVAQRQSAGGMGVLCAVCSGVSWRWRDSPWGKAGVRCSRRRGSSSGVASEQRKKEGLRKNCKNQDNGLRSSTAHGHPTVRAA